MLSKHSQHAAMLAVLKRRERAQVAAETVFGHELIVTPEVVQDLTRSDLARLDKRLNVLSLDCPL